VEVQFILFIIEECAKKLHCKLSADLGNYIIMTGFKNAFSHLYLNIWLNLVAAVCFSVAAYFLNDSFIHSIAMAMLLIALYFAELFMEIKQDLPRRSLFGRPVYSPHFRVRIVQALLGALFLGVCRVHNDLVRQNSGSANWICHIRNRHFSYWKKRGSAQQGLELLNCTES